MKSGRYHNLSSFKQISDYLSNILSQTEKNRLERQSMSDPFEADAFDGFSTLTPQALNADMAELRHKIYRHNKRRLSISYLQIASVILVLIIPSVAIWYIIKLIPKPEPIAEVVYVDEPISTEAMPIYKPIKPPQTKRSTIRFSPPTIEANSESAEMALSDTLTALLDLQASNDMEPKAAAGAYQATNKTENASKKIIKGVILDEHGKALPGASIIIKGSTQRAIADLNGAFVITPATEDATLTASFIGYETVETRQNNDSLLVINMTPDEKLLEQVVVVGYGTQKKSKKELMASTPTPTMGMKKYEQHIKSELKERGVQPEKNRTLVAEVTVHPNGTIKQVKMVSNTTESVSSVLINIIQNGPQWTPAQFDNANIEGIQTIRINY